MEIQERPSLLVERFSWHVETGHAADAGSDEHAQLRADFIESRRERSREMEMEMRRIEAYFSGTRPEDEVRFEKTRRELLDAMAAFQVVVPEEQRTTPIPKSWSDVELAVSTVQAQWEAKSRESFGGRAWARLRKMCVGLHNHSAALEMLPAGNNYVSVIAGAVTMIIKASANYADITKSFAKGASEINDAVAVVERGQVYDSRPIQQLVMRLYTRVFSYLCKFITWYTSRSRTRFLQSFNENVGRTFEEDLQGIREISIQLSQQIQLHMAADMRITKLMGEDTNWAVNYLIKLTESDRVQRKLQQQVSERLLQDMFLDQFNKSREEMRESSKQMMIEFNERMRQSISGAAITDLLTWQAARDLSPSGPSTPSPLHSPGLSPSPNRRDRQDPATPSTQTAAEPAATESQAADIKYHSRHLDASCNWSHVFPFIPSMPPQQLSAHPSLIAALGPFTETMSSNLLYAFGGYSHPSQAAAAMTLPVAQYASLARQHGIPTVSYFCELSAEAPPPPRTRESVELSALICSLIRQVVDLLPAVFAGRPGVELGEGDFERLDGTLRTWREAVGLFGELVGWLKLPQVLFVLNGLNLLEDEGDGAMSGRVKELLEVLARLVDREPGREGPGIVKVLFTTSGASSVLCRELDSSRVVACGDPPSPQQPGRARASRTFFM